MNVARVISVSKRVPLAEVRALADSIPKDNDLLHWYVVWVYSDDADLDADDKDLTFDMAMQSLREVMMRNGLPEGERSV